MAELENDIVSPAYTIGQWCSRFGEVKSLKLESQRDNARGLFALATPFDVLEVVAEEGSVMNGFALENTLSSSERTGAPKKAIIDI